MKVKLLYDGQRPKVDPAELRKVVEDSGLEIDGRKAEVGIVVGGDGIFSMFGKAESEPLLFVGVRSNKATGSKAYMAEAYFDELPEVLGRLKAGDYLVRECPRLEVFKNDKSIGEVFTDLYLQRGDESNSLRYKLRVSGPAGDVEESAIGDGVVIATSAGSRGYYSYLDRAKGDMLDLDAYTRIDEDKIGICHIAPTFIERSGSSDRFVRYAVPWGSRVEVWTTRPANARLYGIASGRDGIKVTTKDRIRVLAGENSTRVVYLRADSR